MGLSLLYGAVVLVVLTCLQEVGNAHLRHHVRVEQKVDLELLKAGDQPTGEVECTQCWMMIVV